MPTEDCQGAMLEDRRIDELEAVIERGLTTFVEVGNAIREIRDSKLYLESHETFEKYCRERWGWSRDYVYKQVRAADTVAVLGNVDHGIHQPNERQARELAPLVKEDPETAKRIWGGLTEEHGEDLTAKHVKQAVQEVKTAKRIREQLPPSTKTIVEGSDPEDSSLATNPKQLTQLSDIARKHGDDKAAEVAERVANGEFKSTFDAYPEVKKEIPELPPKNLSAGERAGLDSIKHFRALTKHDPKEAASVHDNRLDPNAVQDEIKRAENAARWLEEYIRELRNRTRLSIVKGENRVG